MTGADRTYARRSKLREEQENEGLTREAGRFNFNRSRKQLRKT